MTRVAPDLGARVAAARSMTPPDLGEWKRLWWVGAGPLHDAAELGTFPFAGSGRSAAVVAGEGHARLGELLGPQDVCVLLGGDDELDAYVRRVAGGTGAGVVELAAPVGDEDNPTTRFVLAATRVLTLCKSAGAPGVPADDLDRLAAAVDAAITGPPVGPDPGSAVLIIGSGPAAVAARHLAVRLRDDPDRVVEGLDAQDLPGAAADLLGPGTTVVALDPERDPAAPVARMARMAEVEGAAVHTWPGDAALGPVVGTAVLALRTPASV